MHISTKIIRGTETPSNRRAKERVIAFRREGFGYFALVQLAECQVEAHIQRGLPWQKPGEELRPLTDEQAKNLLAKIREKTDLRKLSGSKLINI